MAQKDATLFIMKIFEDENFKNQLIAEKTKTTEEIISFAERNHFSFNKEDYIGAYKSNYKMRWMTYMGKKYIEE